MLNFWPAYTNITDSFFLASQRVRRVDETIASRSGNCIDGTVLFASLIELMGMKPVIVYVSGHAFIGIRDSASEDAGFWFLETTLVGGDSTAYAAYQTGLTAFLGARDSGDPLLWGTSVFESRRAGIVPIPR